MKPEVHNLRRRIDMRGAWATLPAALAILVAIGLTTPHAVELASLNAGATRADADAQACARLRIGIEAFDEARGLDRTRAAIALAASAIPNRCSTVELHSALRLAAADSGWKLGMLNITEPVAMDLPSSGDALGRRSVEMSGSAPLSGIARLVRSLAAHGYPARVLSLTLNREDPQSSIFETHAVLAMFHSIPPQAPAPLPGSEEPKNIR